MSHWISVCMPLIATDVDSIFMCMFVIYLLSLVKCLLKSFVLPSHFLNCGESQHKVNYFK